jgi:hypothetical protein
MVSFDTRHEFDAAVAAVAAAMTDPEFVASLRLPDLRPPEVIEHRSDGAGQCVRAHFEFVGRLDPLGRRVLGGDRIAWTQEITVDASNGRGTLAVVPDAHPERMRFSGEFRLEATDSGGTVRTMRGELAVKVPLIGRKAEQHVLPGLLTRIDLEAEALRSWLAARAAD